MRVLSLAVLLALSVVALPGGQTAVPDHVRRAAEAITAERLSKDLAFLSADELRGRNTPSAGFDTAADFVARRLEKAGVKPLGDNGTYYQHYEMHESRVNPGSTYLEVGGKRFAFGRDVVMRSFAKEVSGSRPAVYVGHGWSIPGKSIDPFAGLDLKGKLVIAHGPRAQPKGIDVRQIGRVTPGATSVVAEAARRGAAAVIYIPQATALSTWEQMAGQNLTRKELVPSVPSAYAAAPATSVLVSREATEAMFAGERSSGAEILALGDGGEYPASFDLLKPIELRVGAETTVHRPYNVVGVVEGSDPMLKGQYITIASHLDGAVGTRTVGGDDVYNSADDNASGSAANLAIAESIGALRPQRSLIFIWDSGEEQGLWGTRHFVGHPPVPLERIVAHINIDMIGANRTAGSPDAEETRVTGPNEVLLIGPAVLSDRANALLNDVNDSYLKLSYDRSWDTPEREFFYPRTDAGPFLERGILTIGFTTGIHARYHLPADEAKALDPNKMEKITRTIFASLWALADTKQPPGIDKSIPPTVPRYDR